MNNKIDPSVDAFNRDVLRPKRLTKKKLLILAVVMAILQICLTH